MEYVLLLGLILLLFLPRLRLLLGQKPLPSDSRQTSALIRVRQIKYFYIHFGFYLITMIAVLLLTQLFGNERVGSLAAILWGLAVALHAFIVFVINGNPIRQWEKRHIRAILDEDSSDQ